MRKFLLVGRTGVGKSSFINTTFGCYIARISEFEPCTKFVEYHAYKTPLGDICLIDTPGLAEDNETLDIKYLNLVKAKVNLNEIYATLYITRLDETRFRPDEKRTLQILTNHLSTSIWNHSVIVLTFAASVPIQKRDELAWIRIKHIEHFLYSLTVENKLYSKFNGFKARWLVDNVVKNWTMDGITALSALTSYKV